MKNKLFHLIFFSLIFVFAGCATVGERDFATRVPIQLGTIQLIKASSAQAVFNTAQDLALMVDEGVKTPEMKSFLINKVAEADLGIEASYVLREVIEEMWFHLEAHSVNDIIPEQYRPRVLQLLSYVADEARFHGAK